MVRRVGCPVCSRPGVNYLMIREMRRDFDDELMMPITIFRHGTCKTKMRVSGIICLDCDGNGGKHVKKGVNRGMNVVTYDFCSVCKGWGIIPRKFEIIPGNGPRPAGSRVFNHLNSMTYDTTNMTKASRRDRLFSRLFKDDRSG